MMDFILLAWEDSSIHTENKIVSVHAVATVTWKKYLMDMRIAQRDNLLKLMKT